MRLDWGTKIVELLVARDETGLFCGSWPLGTTKKDILAEFPRDFRIRIFRETCEIDTETGEILC